MNLLVYFFLPLIMFVQGKNEKPKIGIIGAGIGGASLSYFLSREFPEADITVFEKGELGGRLATVEVDGRKYESGGAIIHVANRYMIDFLDICGLKKRKTPADESFTLHKNGKIVFQEWGYSWVDKLRMAWKYGLWQLLKLENFYTNILSNFVTIYEKLENGVGFLSVNKLLTGMDPVSKKGVSTEEMLSLTKMSLKDKLASLNIDKLLVEELVSVATKFNYGQMPDGVHSFVGAVGLIGFDKKLWAVDGGNEKVVQCALDVSGVKMIRGEVLEVTTAEKSFSLLVNTLDSKIVEETFDMVVIAAALTKDKSNLKIVPSLSQEFPGKYHTTVATIVQGELISQGAGYTDNSVTPNNFYLPPSTHPMWSIERLTPVDYDPRKDTNLPTVYKLFSPHSLSPAELATIFSSIKTIRETSWLAYPSYTTEDDLSSFQLEPGLFYISRIEWAASAMEMSVIAARNVANLVVNYWKDRIKDNDDDVEVKINDKIERIKTEL